MYITRYEAYSMVKDINLSLNDDYALTSLILSILFGVLAFAFCVFAAIAIKRGRIFGILVALLQPVHEAVTIGGFFYNLIIVTLGNIIGGALFVALPYYVAGRRDK